MSASRNIIMIILVIFTSSVLGKELEQKVVSDAIRRFEIVKKHGDIKDVQAQVSKVIEAYLQVKDEENYKKWKNIDCPKFTQPTTND